MILIAHDIRSLYNVGSFFRSADAFQIEKIYLTGYTGCPPRKEISKTALGSEHRVLWEHSTDIFSVIDKLKKNGYRIFALETGVESVSISDVMINSSIALIVGNEVEGISKDILEKCDSIVEIPMPGNKRSLNVSVAAGIGMFAISSKMS